MNGIKWPIRTDLTIRDFCLPFAQNDDKQFSLRKWSTISMTEFFPSHSQVPQQDNFCDCGVYVLQYMESFFEVKVTAF